MAVNSMKMKKLCILVLMRKSGLLYGILVVVAFLALYLLILSKIGLAQAPLQVNGFPTVKGR